MSVKSRILQFQQNTSTTTSSEGSANNSFITANSNSSNGSNGGGSASVIKHANIATVVTNRPIVTPNINNTNNCHSIPVIKSVGGGSKQSSQFSNPNTTSRSITNTNIKIFNNNSSSSRLHKYNNNYHKDYNTTSTTTIRKSESPLDGTVNTFYGIGVDVSLNGKTDQQLCGVNGMSGSPTNPNPTNPPVNRTNKPVLPHKKASMSINLSSTNGQSSSSHRNGFIENGTAGKFAQSPTRPSSLNSSSAIPKPFGPSHNASPVMSNGVVMRKSPGMSSKTTSPATTPTRNYSVGFSPSTLTSPNGNGSSSNRLYGNMGWREKYEESEKKRNHLVNLAQKATRDYEELRRRFHDVYSENEKLSRRLDGATTQLDSLRKASEAVYDDYYKLKKRYEAENREKSDALTRVDQYNKENRRLKRQSAAMMMQIGDPTSLDSTLDAISETDGVENDKEIVYLRNRVQELENKLVDLDSDLEKAKLAEFETQESVMLINDSVNSVKSENKQLKEQLKQLDEENHKTSSALEDISFEYETLKGRYSIAEEKLGLAEAELKKILNEKNILQRQSLVFMNDAMDNRLMDALNQIGDMHTAVEEQRNRFETQLAEIQNQLADRESQIESTEIESASKIRSLEDEVKTLRKRAEDAEQRLEDGYHQSSPDRTQLGTPPPPPPPLPSMCGPAPPPPPPPPSIMNGSPSSLNSSLKSAMCTLRKTGSSNSNGGSGSNTPPNGVSGSPQIDDVISQLKKGIKLRPMDKTLSRKPTEIPQEKQEDTAVEEMRSILNNLRRTRRV